MSRGSVDLRIRPFRLMKKADAAFYCARSTKTFEVQCPVAPIAMANGDLVWDVHDIDAWIESLKGEARSSLDEMIDKLG